MYQTHIGNYQDINITTASKERLILLAYEGAVRFIKQARLHIENHDIPAKCERISRAMAVIEELQASLNMEEGGEIAERLHALYNYMSRRLLTANLRSDIRALDEVLSLLNTIREGWAGIVDSPPSGSGQELPPGIAVAA
jgi:flagellar protein FliS